MVKSPVESPDCWKAQRNGTVRSSILTEYSLDGAYGDADSTAVQHVAEVEQLKLLNPFPRSRSAVIPPGDAARRSSVHTVQK
jgi:hypothetical protein